MSKPTVLKHFEIPDGIVGDVKLELSVKLSSYERKLLKELCEILRPFEEATHLIQQQKKVTGSLPVPVTVELRHKLRALSATYNSKLVTTLEKSITERLTQYLENDHLKLATALDPRFKLQWCENDEKISVDIENLLNVKANSVDLKEEDEQSPPMKKASSGFFSILSGTPRKHHRSQKGIKVSEYLQEPILDIESDPLDFWRNHELDYPHLAKYLGIQASSAAVERLFSIGGKIFRPDRCRLKDETFERLMMIRCNSCCD